MVNEVVYEVECEKLLCKTNLKLNGLQLKIKTEVINLSTRKCLSIIT